MKPNPALCLCAALCAAALASPPAAAQTNGPSAWIKRHWPMRAYHNADGTFSRLKEEIESENWSGYAVTAGSPYATASATWQVPSVTHDALSVGSEYVSNWVGIGGYVDDTLIQLGTLSIVATTGAVFYYAWYELYPNIAIAWALPTGSPRRRTRAGSCRSRITTRRPMTRSRPTARTRTCRWRRTESLQRTRMAKPRTHRPLRKATCSAPVGAQTAPA